MSIFPSTRRESNREGKAGPVPLRSPIVAVVLITLGLLLLLSLLSFDPVDPVLFPSLPGAESSGPSATPHNVVGIIGATLAFGLFTLVGGAAYVVPVFLIVLGGRSLAGEGAPVTVRTLAGAFLAIASLSALMQFQLAGVPTWNAALVASGLAGGLGGRWMAEWLLPYFGYLGSHIVLVAILLISLLLTVPALVVGTVSRIPQCVGGGVRSFQALMRTLRSESLWTRSPKGNKPIKIHRAHALRGGVGLLPRMSSEEEPNRRATDRGRIEAQADHEPEVSENLLESPSFSVSGKVSKSYRLPSPVDLLTTATQRPADQTDSILESQSQVLTQTLQNFGIEGKVTEIHPGPVITMYEFAPGPGIKVARIVNLADDLAMALKALRVRIVAPLPGKSTVGVEVPNPSRETVSLKDLLTSNAFLRARSKLALALGKDIYGVPVVADLRTMPHLLVAGATGAGKSVGLNCMLLNLLFSARPDEVKLLLIDPKVLELQTYDGVPHLIRPVITDPKAAARGLTWAVQEMDRRYRLLAEHGVRSIDAFNRKVAERGNRQGAAPKPGPRSGQAGLPFPSVPGRNVPAEESSGAQEGQEVSDGEVLPLPYIVVVIDEFADLMMVAPKEVEDRIARLAQMARASGIHLILATQRPSVDVVTGLIKANFPARIAYQVSSKIDSRTILDVNGAEALLGRGDMLYMASGTGRITRLHGPFVSDEEVRRVVEWVKRQAAPNYQEGIGTADEEGPQEESDRDDTYERARELVIESGQASASLIQRRLRVGYPRAARMIEQMEQEGLVSTPGRDGRREVLTRQAVMGETG